MASKKTGKQTKKSWQGFFNVNLDTGQKEAIKKLPLGSVKTQERLEELAENGYKISVTWAVDKSAFFVSVTGTHRNPHNEGWTMSQAHSEFNVAVACVWFVVSQMYDFGQWPVDSQEDGEYDW